jgi:HPt (histidine-containing phosphotransfer) domain-containing protein
VDSAIRLQKLMKAFATGDYPAMRGVAFDFKGMSTTIGATRLYALCREIEKEDAIDETRIDQLGEEIARVSSALASARLD